MKIPRLKDLHPPLADAEADHARHHGEIVAMRTEAMACSQRIRDGVPQSGNVEANRLLVMRGKSPEPEVLSDPDRLEFLRHRIDERVRMSPAFDGALQREKAAASKKLCEAVSDENSTLVKDLASKLSALHASHVRYIEFLDAIEGAGSTTSYLRPVWPTAIGHPKDSSGAYHWAFKEMREHGHVTMNQIPEAVR